MDIYFFVQKDDLDFKNNIEVVKLSDVHHPSCKLNQSQGSFGDDEIEPDDLDEEMYDERWTRCMNYT